MISRRAALACLLLLVCATPAAAQTEIHRCIGANGGAVFTDQPCAALKATPVAPPTTPGNPAPTLLAPPPILCAASRDELRQSVIDAFASRDANRLAGLMLWRGYGRGAAIADIRALAELVRQPLLDVELPGDPATSGSTATSTTFDDDPFAFGPDLSPPMPPRPDNGLILHLAGNDGSGSPHERRFSVVRQAGCLWLRNAD